jgi:hypothetical protein
MDGWAGLLCRGPVSVAIPRSSQKSGRDVVMRPALPLVLVGAPAAIR